MAQPSMLSNPDLAPTRPDQRTWSTWHIAALWVGMAVCIPTYTLAASMIDAGMAWWQALLTVALGNAIVLIPMILNGHPGTKYGIPFPVLMRASFGTVGANIPALARALVACGWFGIQTWIGGLAIYQVLGGLGWLDTTIDQQQHTTALGITWWQLACFGAFWLINGHFIWHGIDSIKWLESWAAPFLIAAGLTLLGWAMWQVKQKTGSSLTLFAGGSKFADNAAFWRVFVPQLTAMVGFWATLSLNIPDFTRYARDQRSQVRGQALGLPTTMTLFCFIGIAVTSATPFIFGKTIWDPTEVIAHVGSAPVIIISLAMLSVATLTTNIAANVVSPANDFSNLAPRHVSFRTGGIITAAIGVLIMPWYLYHNLNAYIFTWLIGYSALLGPIAGIMLCDYFVIRRTRLNAAALYDPRAEFAYGGSGFNWRAIVVLVVAVAPNVPGFWNAATGSNTFPAVFDTIYTYAWFLGLALGFVAYYFLMAGVAGPARADPCRACGTDLAGTLPGYPCPGCARSRAAADPSMRPII
ncbi:MAG TPA: NCS1 family nucleobase:cation symporter-1 [Phycisphaerales bacterium]|nr:NCS1 family nucleobase:cation symporter-1 [Phycisphaerales bacterium]